MAGLVVLAAVPAVVMALQLRGQQATIDVQQGQIDRQRQQIAEVRAAQTAGCGLTGEFARWPVLAAERARASPGPVRTVDPALLALGRLAADAYERGGCVGHSGPLPVLPPSAHPRPSPSGGGRG
jgi:hypothetical protein